MKTVHTERLILRQYIKCEADRAVLISLLTDADVMKFVSYGVLTEEKANENFKGLFTNVYEKSSFDVWAVFTRDDSSYIGHAEIKPLKGTSDWEISYLLKKDCWGKGYGTELIRALIEYGFEERKLKHIIATVKAENKPSIRVLEKTGMALEETGENETGEFYLFGINKPQQAISDE